MRENEYFLLLTKHLKKIAFKPLHETNFDIEFCQTKLDSSFDDWFKIKIILR